MRFKLTLKVLSSGLKYSIPINYHYELSAAIYKILASSDVAYAEWLHDNGFNCDTKRFKLFTFSDLVVPRYELDRDRGRMNIMSSEIYWYLGFLPEKSTKQFIKGLFQEQTFRLCDKDSGVDFRITDVEILPGMPEGAEMFTTLSPVCVSMRQGPGPSVYLSPESPYYKTGLLVGLLARYKAFFGKEYEGEVYCDFKVLDNPRSVLLKIKAGTPQQTFVRGYRYRFSLRLPEPLMWIAYESGLGEKGSLGFGMFK